MENYINTNPMLATIRELMDETSESGNKVIQYIVDTYPNDPKLVELMLDYFSINKKMHQIIQLFAVSAQTNQESLNKDINSD